MGRKDASTNALPVDQYRKQIGKQDYKKTKSVLRATRLKAEAKKNSSGFRKPKTRVLSGLRFGQRRIQALTYIRSDAFLVVVAILFFVLCIYAFFYLNLSTELNLDVDAD